MYFTNILNYTYFVILQEDVYNFYSETWMQVLFSTPFLSSAETLTKTQVTFAGLVFSFEQGFYFQ